MTITLPSVIKLQRPPVISRPTITMSMRSNVQPRSRNQRLVLRLHLSQRPPHHEPVYLDYVCGAASTEANTLRLPLEDGKVAIALHDDLRRLGWSTDHTMVGMDMLLESRGTGDARLDLESVTLQRAIADPDALLEAQIELAEEIGAQYGVQVHVNYEASGAEGHMTCFGQPLPIVYDRERRLPRAHIARTMVARGGVVSINHPFSGWKREQLSESRKQELVQEVAQTLIGERGYGARLIEVGFPEGRHDFEAYHYLKLLDLLNLADLRMHAIGVSDAHSNRSWDAGNNFANYLASPDCEQNHLLAAMRSGNFYIADPVRVKAPLSIRTDRGRTMGDQQQGGALLAAIQRIPRGCEWRWIIDGDCVRREATGDRHQSEVSMDEARHFVRGELWDAYDRLILATNPVWIGPDA